MCYHHKMDPIQDRQEVGTKSMKFWEAMDIQRIAMDIQRIKQSVTGEFQQLILCNQASYLTLSECENIFGGSSKLTVKMRRALRDQTNGLFSSASCLTQCLQFCRRANTRA